jgi:hypothetical protein
MSAQCLPNVCPMSAQCLPNVCPMSAQCLPNVCPMSAQCLPNVYPMSHMSAQCPQYLLECLPKVCPMSPVSAQCLPNVSYVCPVFPNSAQCCSRSNLGFLPICFLQNILTCFKTVASKMYENMSLELNYGKKDS